MFVCFVLYSFMPQPLPTFLTTSSPGGNYTLALKGQKTRPVFFTVEVRFDVMKSGTPLLSNMFLFSADGMDPPFESLYPNQRWIDDHSIQFYREENLRNSPDELIIVNNTGKIIRYARINSDDIILFFDLPPGFKTSTKLSPSKGDYKRVYVKSEFADGTSIDEAGPAFAIGSEPKTFYVDLRSDKTIVRGP